MTLWDRSIVLAHINDILTIEKTQNRVNDENNRKYLLKSWSWHEKNEMHDIDKKYRTFNSHLYIVHIKMYVCLCIYPLLHS